MVTNFRTLMVASGFMKVDLEGKGNKINLASHTDHHTQINV